MHDIIERFVGRYEVWRDEPAQKNPLNLFAIIAGITVLQVIYDLFVKHHFTWRVVPAIALDIAFLVLFYRHSPLAWLALPFWGIVILIEFPLFVVFASHYPLRIAALDSSIGLVIGAGLILWGFAIRRRYYSYIGYPH